MYFSDGLRKKITCLKINSLKKYLSTINSRKYTKLTEKRIIKNLITASRSSHAYSDLLKIKECKVNRIKNIEDFKDHVPIIDKQMFSDYSLNALCNIKYINKIRSIYFSSGFSGSFSYGTATNKSLKQIEFSIDYILENKFKALTLKTLVINALPMGVQLPSRNITQVVTSVRVDIIITILKSFKSYFEQFIVVADHLFIKYLLEYGIEKNIDWKAYNIKFITGAEFIAESWRNYIGDIIGVDPGSGKITINMGLTELGISIMDENPDTIRIRRLFNNNHALWKEFLNCDYRYLPEFHQYNPLYVFFEATNSKENMGELVVTSLNKEQIIPQIRYNTHDRVTIISFTELSKFFISHKLPDYVPKSSWPVCLVWDRDHTTDMLNPGVIKEVMYENYCVARELTGSFHIDFNGNKKGAVIFQLQRGYKNTGEVAHALEKMIEKRIYKKITIRTLNFFEFRNSLNYDFERKNKYIKMERK